jgi:hypothetical protein
VNVKCLQLDNSSLKSVIEGCPISPSLPEECKRSRRQRAADLRRPFRG